MAGIRMLACVLLAGTVMLQQTYAGNLVSVWPYPKSVSMPQQATGFVGGPWTVAPETATTIDPSCDARVHAAATNVWNAKQIHRHPARTMAPTTYGSDQSQCGGQVSRQCGTSSDCQGGQTCVVVTASIWNTTHPCGLAPGGAKCGCCVGSLPTVTAVTIVCNATVAGLSSPEGYSLQLVNHQITIHAPSSAGAAYGLVTLAQMLRWSPAGNQFFIDVAPLSIVDEPAYSWRGYMLDTSRHFIPVDDLLLLLKGMHAGKLNIFHWHIVDSPAFPLQTKFAPELANEGSWSQSADTIYTTEDVQTVVAAAQDLFIDVMFEVDTPAHAMSMGRAHPEIMTQCWDWMATQLNKGEDRDDAQAIDAASPVAREFIMNLLQEVASYSPSPYFHIGGDEVRTGCWNSSQSVQQYVQHAFGNLTNDAFLALQADWSLNVAAKALGTEKIPVMWQSTSNGPAEPAFNIMPANTVFLSWLGMASVAAYAKAGKRVVATSNFYVDQWQPGGEDGWYFVVDRWQAMYATQITPSNLTAAEEANVLGGELCAWAENLDSSNVHVRSWQVGGAAAAAVWQSDAARTAAGTGMDVEVMFDKWLCYLRGLGVPTAPLLPSYCDVSNLN